MLGAAGRGLGSGTSVSAWVAGGREVVVHFAFDVLTVFGFLDGVGAFADGFAADGDGEVVLGDGGDGGEGRQSARERTTINETSGEGSV